MWIICHFFYPFLSVFWLSNALLIEEKNSKHNMRATFHWTGPLGRFSLRVAMSVCLWDCAIGCSCFQGLSLPFIGTEITRSVHRPPWIEAQQPQSFNAWIEAPPRRFNHWTAAVTAVQSDDSWYLGLSLSLRNRSTALTIKQIWQSDWKLKTNTENMDSRIEEFGR